MYSLGFKIGNCEISILRPSNIFRGVDIDGGMDVFEFELGEGVVEIRAPFNSEESRVISNLIEDARG